MNGIVRRGEATSQLCLSLVKNHSSASLSSWNMVHQNSLNPSQPFYGKLSVVNQKPIDLDAAWCSVWSKSVKARDILNNGEPRRMLWKMRLILISDRVVTMDPVGGSHRHWNLFFSKPAQERIPTWAHVGTCTHTNTHPHTRVCTCVHALFMPPLGDSPLAGKTLRCTFDPSPIMGKQAPGN